MKLIDFKSLNLTIGESRALIKFLAQRRGVSIKKLLSTIKPNLRGKNNKDLTSKSQQKLIKSIKSQQKLTNQTKSQETLPNTKKIRNSLCNIENKLDKKINNNTNDDFIENIRDLFSNKLDKKINNNNNNDFIENIRDLFSILDYEPVLIKSGFKGNYFEEYLDLIKPHLNDLINTHKNKGEWKIQLTAQINFISLRPGSDETRVMHTRSVNEEFMNGSNTDEVIKALLKSISQKYQENLQEKMKGSDFAFDGINYLYYDLNKITISKGGSYIDFPKWLKNKKSTINPKSNDYKCFQYAITLALNYDKIGRNPQRISKIKPFIENFNWKDIDFPSTRKDWNKFELNNNIALNILYVPFNTKKK